MYYKSVNENVTGAKASDLLLLFPGKQHFCRRSCNTFANSINYYKQQFKQASTEANLLAWGKLIAVIKSLLSLAAVEQLREAYKQEKYFWENF